MSVLCNSAYLLFSLLFVAQEKEEIDFLRENAIDISIDSNDNDFEDLSPLKIILADKRIVGMGESILQSTFLKVGNSRDYR